MCDENTELDVQTFLQKKALTRRGFTTNASAAIAVGGLATTSALAGKTDLTETEVSIKTPDGEVDGIFIHPAKGAHAAVIFWPDIHGVRPAFFEMARDLAAAGYSVLAANPYYRTHKGRLFPDGLTFGNPEGRELAMPHYRSLSVETVKTDSAALVAWLDQQSAVDTSRGIGAVGFCMTGSWTLRAAALVPDRVKAPVSFHGGGLVTDKEDSPHLLASKMKGGALIAIAENDHERQPEAEGVLIEAFEKAGVPAEIEVYEGALHGWVPTDGRVYDQEKSDRALSRMLALFDAQLS